MAAMRRHPRWIRTTAAPGLPRESWVQVDEGEYAEQVQVLASRPAALKIGRVRWRHRLLWAAQGLPARAWRRLRSAAWRAMHWRHDGVADGFGWEDYE